VSCFLPTYWLKQLTYSRPDLRNIEIDSTTDVRNGKGTCRKISPKGGITKFRLNTVAFCQDLKKKTSQTFLCLKFTRTVDVLD
jgi:hypothetical protein